MTERIYLECPLDENVLLVLDHRTVDVFDATETVASGGHSRWHVDHLGVDAKPTKAGMRFTVGLRMPNGDIRYTGGRVKFTVPEGKLPLVMHFFEQAKAARALGR